MLHANINLVEARTHRPAEVKQQQQHSPTQQQQQKDLRLQQQKHQQQQKDLRLQQQQQQQQKELTLQPQQQKDLKSQQQQQTYMGLQQQQKHHKDLGLQQQQQLQHHNLKLQHQHHHKQQYQHQQKPQQHKEHRRSRGRSKDDKLTVISQIIHLFGFKMKGRRKDKEVGAPETEVKDYLREEAAKDRISDAEFFKLVALPHSVDLHEWMATHTISFFNHVNLIYGCVSEFCTADTCPAMSAPDNVQYHWTDDKGKKCKNSAPQYIDYVMSHIQGMVTDETVFPTKFDQSFPADLESRIRRIHRFLFHVMAHLYHAHFPLLRHLGLHGHLNTTFTHFMVFTSKFELVQHKESDLLLHLFSLLLKNLADPTQNPTLREGLGLPLEEGQGHTEGHTEGQLCLEEGQETTITTDCEQNSSGDNNSSLNNTMIDVNMDDTLSSSTTPDLVDTTPRSCDGSSRSCDLPVTPVTPLSSSLANIMTLTSTDLDLSSSLRSTTSNGGPHSPPSPLHSCDTPTKDTNTHPNTLPPSCGEENIHPDLQRQFDNTASWSSDVYSSNASPSSTVTSDISRSRADVVVTEPRSHMKTSSRGSDSTSSPSEWLANLQVSAT